MSGEGSRDRDKQADRKSGLVSHMESTDETEGQRKMKERGRRRMLDGQVFVCQQGREGESNFSNGQAEGSWLLV